MGERQVESATGHFQKELQQQNPAGEWWELFDDVHNLPYYYNTKTSQTEWERPQDSSNIVSLTTIQACYSFKSVIGQRLSLHLSGVAGLGLLEQSGIAKQDVEGLRIASASELSTLTTCNDSAITPTDTPTELFAPLNDLSLGKSLGITEHTTLTSPNNSKSIDSTAISQKATGAELASGPELSPPLSPTTSSSFMDLSTWRYRSKSSNSSTQPQQPSPSLSTNAFVSTIQKAASMTLNRHSLSSSSTTQPVPIPSRPKSGAASHSAQPLSTSHPPMSTGSGPAKLGSSGVSNDPSFQPARKSFQIAERARKFGIGAPIANDEAARKMSPMIMEQQQEALRKMTGSPPPTSPKSPIREGSQVVQPYQPKLGGSIFPPGTHPALPAELQSSISQFRIAGFAQKYFSTHKKGLFRRKVPMEKMLLHQKSPLSQPLMVLNKRGVQKDALRCFKIIQKLMGERKGNGYVGPTGIELGETCIDLSIQTEDDIKLVLELIKKGLDHGELRDEIYVQLCKQLTENPSREGSIKGWHLFTILLITFAPSKNLHEYLASFLNQHCTSSLHPIPVMARHCIELLRRISKRGARAKQLSLVEIARAQEAAFRPSVFEATLERLMGRQMAEGGEWAAWRVPRLMVFLKESVINLGGLKTEGIFRISGDLGAVAELRARIELGNYDISGITDPHVPCSLLRLWIRDLPEPIIPYEMYQQCIQGAQDKDAIAMIVSSLPMWHKEMMIYLMSFLKSFNNQPVKEATKMSLSNLAMVFAPTLLQCSSEDAPMLMGHLQAERAFVSTLISEVELSDEDLRIVGEATC
ncbi:hypothetical protein BGZ76_010746 [Entomortierella beljakovae]|nr:hypothetical protein BGZ76_010746 [Entomortierella beljakovae]